MSRKRLDKTFEKVRVLSVATPRARKQLIENGDRELINCVSECCLNILHGKVPLNATQKSQLAKHKNKLRAIAKKKVSIKKKKEIIQKGGFPFGAILAPVASFLASMLTG